MPLVTLRGSGSVPEKTLVESVVAILAPASFVVGKCRSSTQELSGTVPKALQPSLLTYMFWLPPPLSQAPSWIPLAATEAIAAPGCIPFLTPLIRGTLQR